MQTTLTASGITRSFGARTVLKGLDLVLAPGEVYGLVGLNGAGKTTLIRLLLGLLSPDCGTVTVLGRRPGPDSSLLYREVGVVLEHEGFAGNLTIAQNLSFFARAKGVGTAELDAYFQRSWSRTAIADTSRKAKHLSRGQKMQGALCRAFLGRPKLCLFDEPVVALDVTAYDHFCDMVREARSEGATVLISSHQLEAIEELCDRVGILEEGAIASVGEAGGATTGQRWILRAPGDQRFADAIRAGTNREPRRSDGVWEFRIEGESAKVIPSLVRSLVEAGCPIEEIRPASGGIRESLRSHFRNPATPEHRSGES
jgi:ABC-type multidrug transport system ATPase subunit